MENEKMMESSNLNETMNDEFNDSHNIYDDDIDY